MAAISEVGLSRKRLTTYGKAGRRRLLDHTPAEIHDLPKNGDADPTDEPSESLSSSKIQSASITSSISRPQLIPSHSMDLFDIPSTNDDANTTPKKRRKVAHSARKPIERHSHNLGAQQHQPLKLPHTSITSIPSGLQRKEKITPIQQMTRPLGVTNHIHDHLLSPNQAEKAISVKTGTVASPRRPINLSTRRSNDIGKRTRHTGVITSSPHSTPTENIPKVELRAAPSLLESPSTPSAPSVTMENGRSTPKSSTAAILTPRRQRMWDGLFREAFLVPQEDFNTATLASSSRGRVGEKHEPGYKVQLPRRRLIDSLVEQSERPQPVLDIPSDEDQTEEGDVPELDLKHKADLVIRGDDDIGLPRHYTQTTASKEEVIPILPAISSQNSQIAGPRITYSRQRSMLAEQEVSEKLAFDVPIGDSLPRDKHQKRRGSIPTLVPLHSLQEQDEVEDGHTTVAIRTIHELRQAGAQSRFLDEVEDLLDRIGTPIQQLSMRRSGLMDLADKMKDKEFYQKFLSNGLDQRLFLHLGQEKDVISGFFIISLLIIVLDSGITPVAISQLRRQGITRLIIYLLDFKQSITSVAKDDIAKVSKSAQMIIAQHHDTLLELSIWEDRQPEYISPRTVSLRCLEMIVRQSREAGNTADLISKELKNKLFHILKNFNLSTATVITGPQTVDFSLTLSTLESHSLKATTSLLENLPVIRDVLGSVLRFSGNDSGFLQLLTLRLTLNVTNNDATASDVFATTELLRSMSDSISSRFNRLSKFLIEDERVALVDHLVLLLGVMMNFAEWSVNSRQILQTFQGSCKGSFDDLVTIFSDNLERISEADSVEDSQRNVAFGYLAVVLGYFSETPELEERVRQRLRSLKPLISSIDEFISHHEKVDEILKQEIDGYNPQTSLTERFQRMVNRLKTREALKDVL